MKTYKEQIKADLNSLGVKEGDCLLVHSSYTAIGKNENGPAAVIQAILDTIGTTGTLLMPCFNGGQQYSQATSNKVFEIQHTPSQLGIISEIFRKEFPVRRSLHPTHSVIGMGPLANEILEGHEKCLVSTGIGTPFDKLKKYKAKIILLGVTHSSNTFLHHIENVLGAPTLSKNKFTMKLIDDKNNLISVETHPHLPGLPRQYDRLNSELPESLQKSGTVGKAKTFVIEAGALFEHLKPLLQNNPLYLIKPFQI